MKKSLTIGGGVLLILSFLTATANAKSLPAISLPQSITNDLSDQLASDKDFQEFSFLLYDLTGKIQATKSGRLLLNYFEHKNTAVESNSLFAKLEFSSEKKFRAFWNKAFMLKTSFQEKYADLFKLSDAKMTIEIAAQKVSIEKYHRLNLFININ